MLLGYLNRLPEQYTETDHLLHSPLGQDKGEYPVTETFTVNRTAHTSIGLVTLKDQQGNPMTYWAKQEEIEKLTALSETLSIRRLEYTAGSITPFNKLNAYSQAVHFDGYQVTVHGFTRPFISTHV